MLSMTVTSSKRSPSTWYSSSVVDEIVLDLRLLEGEDLPAGPSVGREVDAVVRCGLGGQIQACGLDEIIHSLDNEH